MIVFENRNPVKTLSWLLVIIVYSCCRSDHYTWSSAEITANRRFTAVKAWLTATGLSDHVNRQVDSLSYRSCRGE